MDESIGADSQTASETGGLGGGDDAGDGARVGEGGGRGATSRLLSRLTPAQKTLLGAIAAAAVAGATLGVVFGLGAAPTPNGAPLPPVSGVVPSSALQTIAPNAVKPGDPAIEEAAGEQPQVDEDASVARSQSQPSTEPSQSVQGPPDESQLGDQPGDVNLPDNPDQTSPDY